MDNPQIARDINKKTAFVVGSVMLIAVFAPQLFGGFAYSNGDPLLAYYPNLTFYKAQLLSGQSFLWTPGLLSGFPLYSDLLGGLYSPVNYLLFKYFSVFTAYNLAILTAASLIFLCTYFFMREIKVTRAGSLVATIAFTFGYHISNWSNVIPSVNTYFLMPLLFEWNRIPLLWLFLLNRFSCRTLLPPQPEPNQNLCQNT